MITKAAIPTSRCSIGCEFLTYPIGLLFFINDDRGLFPTFQSS